MDNLTHKGRIIAIEGRRIEVEMQVDGACAACRIKGVCGAGESADKVVTVLTDMSPHYAVGEEVEVSVSRIMGIRAVIYAYVFPFFLMLAVLLILLGTGQGDIIAGLSALGIVIIYYIALGFMRKRIEKDIVFKISKI